MSIPGRFPDEPPDDWDDDIPAPPPPEFERLALDALLSPGLFKHERAELLGEARRRREGGMSREAASRWLLEAAIDRVAVRVAFGDIDLEGNGNVVEPPHIAEARAKITRELKSKAGAHRHDKHNADFAKWVERCRELLDQGVPLKRVLDLGYRAVSNPKLRQTGGRLPAGAPSPFVDLPPLFGRDGKSILGRVGFQRHMRKALEQAQRKLDNS